jgi:hypothetical protein
VAVVEAELGSFEMIVEHAGGHADELNQPGFSEALEQFNAVNVGPAACELI